ELAAKLGAALHLVGAYGGLAPRAAPALMQGAPAELAWLARTAERTTQTLERAAREARDAGVQTTCHPRRGEPADAIISVAEEVDAELIVVGNRGMSAARRHVLGSVPGKVSHHAPCSVLIVRTG
ncbi:MAG: universal stress protein, partial [Actinomycetota bacterium]|nr:universal stress protein [Actinomycetota bacterium]